MIKPTLRDVRVALAAVSTEFKVTDFNFNDKRKNGGRIKLGFVLPDDIRVKLQELLSAMFPQFKLTVSNWSHVSVMSRSIRPKQVLKNAAANCTVIHFTKV